MGDPRPSGHSRTPADTWNTGHAARPRPILGAQDLPPHEETPMPTHRPADDLALTILRWLILLLIQHDEW
ncbi:hypothetical protein [Actinoplanes sp. RD1]|uniref:hypothetical protein n=1 Tax=Actinoplanes sp. RD1 TaxID=3064538 RepID=UPI00274068C1|nr:hypothetical protein [Actinoplanes sp. RD1]